MGCILTPFGEAWASGKTGETVRVLSILTVGPWTSSKRSLFAGLDRGCVLMASCFRFFFFLFFLFVFLIFLVLFLSFFFSFFVSVLGVCLCFLLVVLPRFLFFGFEAPIWRPFGTKRCKKERSEKKMRKVSKKGMRGI